MRDETRPLDVTEEVVTQSRAVVRSFDQTWNVGNHQRAIAEGYGTQNRCEGRERIPGDLWMRR